MKVWVDEIAQQAARLQRKWEGGHWIRAHLLSKAIRLANIYGGEGAAMVITYRTIKPCSLSR